MSLSLISGSKSLALARKNVVCNGILKHYFSTEEKPLYSERMAKMGRPVSPHVFIYDFPVVALSSITNRVMGVALYGGIAGAGLLALAGLELGPMLTCLGNMDYVGPAAKVCVAYPVVYHYLGGLRHIVWDYKPDMLTNEQVKSSSLALFAATAGLAAGAAFITLPAKEQKKEDA